MNNKKNFLLTVFLLYMCCTLQTSFAIIPPAKGVNVTPRMEAEFQKLRQSYGEGYWAHRMKERLQQRKQHPEVFAKSTIVDTAYAPTLMGAYSDLAAVYSRELFQQHLFDGPNPTGTVTEYYQQISYGQMYLTSHCEGWFPMPRTLNEYRGNNNGLGSQGGARFTWELLQAADPTVDFRPYVRYIDGQGKGHVPFVIVIHTGADAAAGAPNIWSHVSSFRNFSGQAFTTNDTLPDGNQIIIDGPYAIEPERQGSSNTGGNIETIGVFCHELGHIFGLPDLYAPTGSGEGVGNWCLMSGGAYGGDGSHSEAPSQMSAWCKAELGWVSPTVINAPVENLEIAPATIFPVSYKVWRSGGMSNEYFIIENRQKKNYDRYLYESGLLIYHVDENIGGQGNPNHYKVDVEQADGMKQLNAGVNRGDTGDPFPGSNGANNPNVIFDGYTQPDSRDYSGELTYVAISNIHKQDSLVFANVTMWDTASVFQSFENWSDFTGLNDTGDTYGVAASDFDNDGFVDMFVANNNGSRLYKNSGNGFFNDVTNAAGVNDTEPNRAALWFDYDNDGNTDLYLITINILGATKKNKLFHNNGNGTFARITSSNLEYAARSTNAVAADFNNDGWLDVMVLHTSGNVKLFKNTNGIFEDVTTASGINFSGNGVSCVWGDYDFDGDDDVYIVARNGISQFYNNNGNGTFSDATATAGVTNNGTGQSASFGDYNNDGWLDLVVVNQQAPIRLFQNNGNGTFAEMTQNAGINSSGGNIASLWLDFDADSDLDLFVAKNGPQKLFRNNGNGMFEEYAGRAGISGVFNPRTMCSFDFDNNGFSEIYLGCGTMPNVLFKNFENGNHTLSIQLVGNPSNRSAIGTKIVVVSNGIKQLREISSSNGTLSENSFVQMIGLGSSAIAETLKIFWNSGSVTTMNALAAGMYKIFETPDGVEELPDERFIFSLEQNYPNPFNPQTAFHFSLATAAVVTLKIFDVVGKEISSPVSAQEMNAGKHTTYFDGTPLASGTYFFRLSVNDNEGKIIFSQTKKFLFIK
jgi:immune inhibitor A